MKKSRPKRAASTSQSVSFYDNDDSVEATKRPSAVSFGNINGDVKFGHSGNRSHRIQHHPIQHGHGHSHSESDNPDLHAFDLILQSNNIIIISTEKKTAKEVPGKTTYEITIPDGQKVGFLVPEYDASWFDKVCFPCPYHAGENDPMSYYITGKTGKELISIYGLDEDVASEDTVQIARCKYPIGTIKYGHLGVTNTLSRVSVAAGREKNFMVPISVIEPSGNLLYIFRSFPRDDITYTELLSVDGSALPVAEIKLEFLILKPFEKHQAETIPLIPPTTPPQPRTQVFSVNFIEEMSPEDKSFVLGIAVAIFNRWARRNGPKRANCTIV